MEMKYWQVTVEGFPPVVFPALTRGRAMSEAYRQVTHVYDDLDYRRFLKMANARKTEMPAFDPYEDIAAYYNVKVRPGDKVVAEGTPATVYHPCKPCGAYVHCFDGAGCTFIVHPMGIEKDTPNE